MTKVAFIAHTFVYEKTRINIFHADAGDIVPRHKHTSGHALFCAAGSFVIRKDNKELTVNKYTQPINVIANEWHEIEVLEDGTVFCNAFPEKY